MRIAVLIALMLGSCAEQRAAVFVPPTHRDGDRVVMPLTFPDGTRITLTYPPELAIAELGLRPYGSGTLRGKGRDFLVHYGAGARTAARSLRFEFGPWTVEVYDHGRGSPAAMTAAERRRFRAGLGGRVTDDGFLILEADPPLRLARAGEHAGPALEFGMTRDSPWLKLTLARCGPKAESDDPGFSSWCLSDSVVAHAYGDRRFRAAAAEGIELR